MQVDEVLPVLEALEGHWVLKEFVSFEEAEDPVEPEDHELLGLLGLKDLLHLPLFFYFRYVFSHLLIIWYMYSSVSFFLSSCDN